MKSASRQEMQQLSRIITTTPTTTKHLKYSDREELRPTSRKHCITSYIFQQIVPDLSALVNTVNYNTCFLKIFFM